MKIYSDFAPHRTRQVVADLIAVTVISIGIAVGVTVTAAIARLADIARQVQSAGSDFQNGMTGVGDVFAQLPLVGDSARAPFDAAGAAGSTLWSAGQNAELFITGAASAAGVIIAIIIALAVMMVWLPPRIRFTRRATEATKLVRLPDGHDLLALRALVTASRRDLGAIAGNPVQAWRNGDRDTVRRLAALELRDAGVSGAAR